MATLKVTVKISPHAIVEQKTDSIAFFVEQDFDIQEMSAVSKAFFPALSHAMSKQKFSGKALSSLVVPGSSGDKVTDLIFVGLGKKNKQGVIDPEIYRKALGAAARIVEARKGRSLSVQLPKASLFGFNEYELSKQTTITLQMALYHFDEFITDEDRKIKDLKEVDYVINGGAHEEVQKGIDDGNIIALSVNTCRYWIDLPPEQLTPIDIAHNAEKIGKGHGLKTTIFNEKEIIAMGMGGLAAVSRGSERDAHLVIMEYEGKKGAPTIGFVGKGITFDSGGLSIKPAASMETMKEDMSGAAAVIAAMLALAKLKPEINIVALTPLSENLPSGKATKPGDIARFYNGKTAEIKNTDAEGRLILADALSYAVKHYKLDALIDLATLTGACAYALGPHFTGLMSQHDEFTQRVCQAAEKSGDKVWRLPLPDEYKAAIKSPVADICNIGSPKYMAGAVTAALFLQNFVDKVPWVHLDIAGTAYDVPDISYYRDGATGVGVRLLIELAMNWK